MDCTLQVILVALLIASTIAQLLENIHGPHGARNPARLIHAGPSNIFPGNPIQGWNHGHPNEGNIWVSEYPLYQQTPNEYKDNPVVFEYVKPVPALENYLHRNKSLPVHYGVIDWDEIRKYAGHKSHFKGKFVVIPTNVENKKKIKHKTVKKLEAALRNNCDNFLWRSKEKNSTNIYDLTDPNNVWNLYVDYGLKGPVKVRKNVLGTTNYTLGDPLVILKGILQKHPKIPLLTNGYIDWNEVFKLSEDDYRFFKSQLIPPSKKPVWI